jgi:V/A-type H+/Na+-transporting ATPase subunit E
MTLEDLVEEIRRRGEADLEKVSAERAKAEATLAADRDHRLAGIRSESERTSAAEIARDRTQRIAAAKLKARKMLYEAREARLGRAVEETKSLLRDFTQSSAYVPVLRRMVAAATASLGKQVRVMGRAEDAAALAKVAGKLFDPTPQPILGGLIAETPDGSRRLNLSFDELLRLNEDRVRDLLA